MGKKFTVEEQIRLQDELQEIIEKYGAENVVPAFQQYIDSYQGTQKLVQGQPQQNNGNPNQSGNVQAIHQEEPEKPAIPLPPTVHNLEDYIRGLNEIVPKGQVSQDMLDQIREFVAGAKMIFQGDLDDKNFIMGLTAELFQDRGMRNPYEEWIEYNSERVRKYLKRHLRLKGYDFLDSEVESGKPYDPKKHNCVKTEVVKNSSMDGRVLKVTNEGLIIGRILHINCNVIVGKFLG